MLVFGLRHFVIGKCTAVFRNCDFTEFVVTVVGLRGTRYKENGEDYITRSFMLCTLHEISFV